MFAAAVSGVQPLSTEWLTKFIGAARPSHASIKGLWAPQFAMVVARRFEMADRVSPHS
jgi:hypothetical protein